MKSWEELKKKMSEQKLQKFESWWWLFSVWLDLTLLLVLTPSRIFLSCEAPSHSNDEPGLGSGRVDCSGWGPKAVVWRPAGEEYAPSSVVTWGDSEVLCRRSWFSSTETIRANIYEAWKIKQICESFSLLWENSGSVRGSRGGHDRRGFSWLLDARSGYAAGDQITWHEQNNCWSLSRWNCEFHFGDS